GSKRPAAARELPLGRQPPVARLPHVRVHAERVLARLVDVQATGLAPPVRAGLAEPGSDRDGHAVLASGRDLELAALAYRRLVDVPGEDQLGARVDQGAEHVVAARYRLLARPPGRADQVVVENGHPQSAGVR